MGLALTPEEVKQLLTDQYGDQSLRDRPLLLDPHQAQLMAQGEAARKAAAAQAEAAEAGRKAAAAAAAEAARLAAPAGADRLAGRLMPAGAAAAAAGALQGPPGAQADPLRHQQVTHVAGRKRIAPTPVSPDGALLAPPAAAASGSPAQPPPPKRLAPTPVAPQQRPLLPPGTPLDTQQAAAQQLALPAPHGGAAAAAPAAPPPPVALLPLPQHAELVAQLGSRPDAAQPAASRQLVLHAANTQLAARGGPMAELTCRWGVLWGNGRGGSWWG